MREELPNKSLRQWRREAFAMSFTASEFMMPVVLVACIALAITESLWFLLVVPAVLVVLYVIRFLYLYIKVCKMDSDACDKYIREQKALFRELADENY